jgi:hypothetical protein
MSHNAGRLLVIAYSLGISTEWPEEFRKDVRRLLVTRCCAFICLIEPIVERVIPFWFGDPYFANAA